MDYSPPGFTVHGISQARILEWVALPFSIESIECHFFLNEAQYLDMFIYMPGPGYFVNTNSFNPHNNAMRICHSYFIDEVCIFVYESHSVVSDSL